MNKTTIGGNKRKLANALAMIGLIIIFIAYMFPFLMGVINSLKEKRDIIKSPFSWLFTIKAWPLIILSMHLSRWISLMRSRTP